MGLINKELMICQTDKQIIFGEFKLKDNNARLQVRRMETKKRIVQSYLMDKEATNYDKIVKLGIKDRSAEGLKRAMLDFEKLSKSWMEIRNNLRDRTCRICWHPLNCPCEQCRKRHHGDQISSAMTYGHNGFRGEFYPMHLICGRILFQRFGIMLLETKPKQQTLA